MISSLFPSLCRQQNEYANLVNGLFHSLGLVCIDKGVLNRKDLSSESKQQRGGQRHWLVPFLILLSELITEEPCCNQLTASSETQANVFWKTGARGGGEWKREMRGGCVGGWGVLDSAFISPASMKHLIFCLHNYCSPSSPFLIGTTHLAVPPPCSPVLEGIVFYNI